MQDYTLESPDGDVIVTGDGSERARLVNSGWTEVTQAPPPKKPAEPKPDPVKAAPEPEPVKPNVSSK